MNAKKTVSILARVTAAFFSAVCCAQAQTTRTWTGAVSAGWTDAANWQDSLAPGDGDDVLVPAAATRNPAIPAGVWPSPGGRYGSFEVQSGRTVTCMGDPTVTNEASGGGATGDGKIHGIGVTIRCGSALIDGTLTANQQGFPAGQGPGAGRNASHGGGVAAYGNLQQPTALGSGSDTQYGGGAIALLATGTITVNGTISADGIGDNNRASAGGSVWLQCDTLAGSAGGVIRAQGGGYAGRSWGGGGGRISLDYQTRTYAGTVTAPGGGNGNWQILEGGGLRGQAGTLWEPNREFPRSGGTVAQWGPRVFAWCDAAGDANGGELANEAAYTLRGLAAGQKAAVWVNNAFYDTLTADGQGALTLAAVALAPDASLRVEIPAGGTLLLFR